MAKQGPPRTVHNKPCKLAWNQFGRATKSVCPLVLKMSSQ